MKFEQLLDLTREFIMRVRFSHGAPSLFPNVTTMMYYGACMMIGCVHLTRRVCWFNCEYITSINLCARHYELTLLYIIDNWSYCDLQQRILSIRTWKPLQHHADGIDAIHQCERCGIRTSSYKLMKPQRVVCTNCYEYSFGDKCRFAIMVLHRIVNIDVVRYVVTTLHQSFMPNYSNIAQQVYELYSS